MIFCLPKKEEDQHWFGNLADVPKGKRTVTAWLHRSFDVADALDGDTVLVVAVDELILKLADFVDQDTELIGDI